MPSTQRQHPCTFSRSFRRSQTWAVPKIHGLGELQIKGQHMRTDVHLFWIGYSNRCFFHNRGSDAHCSFWNGAIVSCLLRILRCWLCRFSESWRVKEWNLEMFQTWSLQFPIQFSYILITMCFQTKKCRKPLGEPDHPSRQVDGNSQVFVPSRPFIPPLLLLVWLWYQGVPGSTITVTAGLKKSLKFNGWKRKMDTVEEGNQTSLYSMYKLNVNWI